VPGAITLAIPEKRRPDGACLCNRLIYKRACQGHFSPSTGRGKCIRDFQPHSFCAAYGFGFLPLVRAQVLRDAISVPSLNG